MTKSPEDREEEKRKRARDKDAALPERVELKSHGSSIDLAHDVDDVCAKLLATAQDAAFLSAKVACLAEQTALRDKLVLSETGMKHLYHKLIEQRTASKTHKSYQYTEMVEKPLCSCRISEEARIKQQH